MVGSAATAGNYVVNLEYPEWKLGLAAVAAAFLPSEEDVLVLSIVDGSVNVGTLGNVRACGDKPRVEEAAHEFLEAYVDEFDGLRGDVYTDPLATVLTASLPTIAVSAGALPSNFAAEAVRAEYRVHERLEIVGCGGVAV